MLRASGCQITWNFSKDILSFVIIKILFPTYFEELFILDITV